MKKPVIAALIIAFTLIALGTASEGIAQAATTTATAQVAAGTLSISAPATLDLGVIIPGQTGSGTLTGVEVTDARAGTAGWTASVAITDFTSVSLGATIPAADTTYTPAPATTTGTVTVTATPVTGGAAAAIQTATAVAGNNTATWNATVSLAVPAGALAANDYTATITHSVA